MLIPAPAIVLLESGNNGADGLSINGDSHSGSDSGILFSNGEFFKAVSESCYKKVTFTADMISEQARGIDLDDMTIYKDNSMPIFESHKNQHY